MTMHILPVGDQSPEAILERERAAWEAERRGYQEQLDHQATQMESVAAVMAELRALLAQAEADAEGWRQGVLAFTEGGLAPDRGLKADANPYRDEPGSVRFKLWDLGCTSGLTAIEYGLALDALTVVSGRPLDLIQHVIRQNLELWLEERRRLAETATA